MAFNYDGLDFLSFALYADVTQRDSRLFESNEGLTEAVVNELLELSSQRILGEISASDWWRAYVREVANITDPRLVPDVNPDNIDAREQAFKDLNIYNVLADYILPRIADFGNETSSEVVKIKHYTDQYNRLLQELAEAGDWYDYDGDATIEYNEKQPSRINLVRIR